MNQMTLFIVGLLNGRQREREEGWGGGLILLLILPFITSSSSFIFFPTTHCCQDKRIRGETLFLPFSISAVFSKSPDRRLLGWKCQATEVCTRCRAWSCCCSPHTLPNSLSTVMWTKWDTPHTPTPELRGSLTQRGHKDTNHPFTTTIGWTLCPWMEAASWPEISHTGPLFPGNKNIQATLAYVPVVFRSWTKALFKGPGYSAKDLLLVLAVWKYSGANPSYGLFCLLIVPADPRCCLITSQPRIEQFSGYFTLQNYEDPCLR